MEINPRQNGFHSLAKALESFKEYHESGDVFSLKDTILRTHHGIETLFKDILYSINPAFLIRDDKKIKDVWSAFVEAYKGQIATPFEKTGTIYLKDTIARVNEIGLLTGFGKKEYFQFSDSIDKLNSYRNKIQHLGISANPDEIGRILGNSLPRAIDILDSIYKNNNIFGVNNVISELKKFFPETQEIIELLRHDYDELVQESINFFKGRIFNNQKLHLRIMDNGKIGIIPNLSELTSSGFLELNYDLRKLMDLYLLGDHEEQEQPYSGRVTISEPTFSPDGLKEQCGITDGELKFEAQIVLDRAEKVFTLPEVIEKISVLREIIILITAKVNYRAEAISSKISYYCENLKELEGELNVEIRAVPKGYASDETEVIGHYSVALNKDNAPFRINSFREPDGRLDHTTLEWNINAMGTLMFD